MMSIEHSGAVTVTDASALLQRLHGLTRDSTDYHEVAAVNLLAAGISLLIAARGHHTTIEMLERAIAVVEDDRASFLGKPLPIDDKPTTLPAKTGGTLTVLGMRGRGPLRG
jgi:hypothetical protein